MTKHYSISYKIDIDSKSFRKVLKSINGRFERLEKEQIRSQDTIKELEKNTIEIALKSIDLNKDQIIVIKSDNVTAEQVDCIKAIMSKRFQGSNYKIAFLFLPNDTKIDIVAPPPAIPPDYDAKSV